MKRIDKNLVKLSKKDYSINAWGARLMFEFLSFDNNYFRVNQATYNDTVVTYSWRKRMLRGDKKGED